MNELIETQVKPLKDDAIEKAVEYAKETIDRVKQDLAKFDNDINVAAPYPSGSGQSRSEYAQMVGRYKLFVSLTKTDDDREQCPRHNTPRYVKICPTLRKRFIEHAKRDAAAQYDAFVAKLSGKAEDASDAEIMEAGLIGNHVWGHSHLVVKYSDGEELIWRTQMIMNVSKLGKVFNQWPSRKVKKVNG